MSKLTALALAALVLALPAPAFACMNPILLKGDRAVRTLVRAEQLLKAGKHQRAYDALVEFEFEPAAERRARLIVLTARVRLLAGEEPVDERRVHLLVLGLRDLRAQRDDDPLVQARLAEALALTGAGTEEAEKLLEDLVERDLMPEPEAWLTLAQLRAHREDAAGVAAALQSCTRMAGKRKALCREPKVEPTS